VGRRHVTGHNVPSPSSATQYRITSPRRFSQNTPNSIRPLTAEIAKFRLPALRSSPQAESPANERARPNEMVEKAPLVAPRNHAREVTYSLRAICGQLSNSTTKQSAATATSPHTQPNAASSVSVTKANNPATAAHGK